MCRNYTILGIRFESFRSSNVSEVPMFQSSNVPWKHSGTLDPLELWNLWNSGTFGTLELWNLWNSGTF
jgi:hypothetical protein